MYYRCAGPPRTREAQLGFLCKDWCPRGGGLLKKDLRAFGRKCGRATLVVGILRNMIVFEWFGERWGILDLVCI